MKVTALKVQARNPNRVNVYLDDAFALGLAKILAVRLRIGQTLTDADLEQWRVADADEQAYERALKFLAVRPRSEVEVRQRLQKHKVTPAAIEAVITRLREANLLDDGAFARYWVENRNAFRPRSQQVLRQELRRKGVTGEALGEAVDDANDAENAYALAIKRAPRLAALPEFEYRRKLSDFLARRGFRYDLIETIIERVQKEVPPAPPADDLAEDGA